MRKILALAVLFAAISPISIFAQDPPVGVQSHQNGNAVSFTVYNDTSSTVCVFPQVVQAQTYNVYGSVVPMIQLNAGEQNVNIGAYAQSDPHQDWSVYVAARYRTGTCA